MWRISIHHDFDSLGGPLSPCGSHWLRLEPFTQIRSRTLCVVTYYVLFHYILHILNFDTSVVSTKEKKNVESRKYGGISNTIKCQQNTTFATICQKRHLLKNNPLFCGKSDLEIFEQTQIQFHSINLVEIEFYTEKEDKFFAKNINSIA